jgi:hypothetical protein
MKTLLKTLISIGLLVVGTQVQALIITPSHCSDFGGSITCIAGAASNSNSQSTLEQYIQDNYGLDKLYNQDVGASTDLGSLAGSYTTTFGVVAGDDPLDPGSANIVYDSGDAVSCPTCLLLVKDGNQEPASFIFDLSSIWDGMETISIRDFWPNQGAISHVSFYGKNTPVPEPSMVGLLAIGLIGAAVARRKIK